ncbi:hypothetical protein J2Z83_003125 [Virgibacillus natechei]|uniref:Uncharacterized protein n=1 Tax=Virgibacillus natechei TaxID=1216297 RepID=A0ABS4IJD2_9BACI|nr:hypothetical protein [Virgibacillus natechei]MBP1970988.1 hypothetical protein [Virgibacillus natechei]UZD12752.1 hypothetical protein OLD84_17970 [Virgibacillus natechei]
MKQKGFTIIILGALLFLFAIPAYAASNSFSFTMEHRVVDGSANGEFMTLSRGSAALSGSHYISSSKSGAGGPNQIAYQLCNQTSGNCFGIIRSTPRDDGLRRSFNGTYTGLGGGTSYYLMIYRGANDGHTISGSGTVRN